ncbi:cache domain-containing sensor histidine kinase [Cohnella hashimotonis]|uniref:Sensor histidine kinase n=1 Tax=Cohnella hashimotonis TaxID=2826895 RepID=A0ABT6TUQ1_9BACL|nr:sensor histidine kinase [Cohnella hashimotonis]MDI4650050.1 sensor histidine kinase [Cohnella hashimotonis]
MNPRPFPIREWNLNAKLISLYSVTIIVPVILLTMFGFQRYNENLQRKVGEYGLSLTDQVSKNLDTYVQQIDRMASTFYLDVWDTISPKIDRGNPADAFREKVMVDRALRNILLAIPFSDLLGAYWIGDGQVMYSQYGTGEWIDHTGFEEAGWYEQVLKMDGKGLLIPPYKVNTRSGEKFVLSYARSIVNVSNRQSYGVLLLDFSTDGLKDLTENLKSSAAGTLFILDGSGRIAYHPDPARMLQPFPLQTDASYGYYKDDIGGVATMIHYVRSPATGWTLVNTIEVSHLSNELVILRRLLWNSAIVLLLVSITLTGLLTTTINRPLKELKRLMHRVEMGDYNVKFQTRSNDEMNRLGRSFNAMVAKLNELVNHVLHMKIYRQQAQVSVLRSQINPHFLYNTLESINMKAEMNGDYEVADMVTLLGKLFRLSLRSEAETVPLFRELEYVSVFMRLQRIRFPRMTFETDIPDSLLALDVPQWIVQPLIENAIIHGRVPAKKEGWIRVRAKAGAGGELTIFVEDNGTGIAPDRLEWLRVRLSAAETEEAEDGEHIGLRNVHRRIRFLCGDGYGLFVSNRAEGGTVVEIRLTDIHKERDRGA